MSEVEIGQPAQASDAGAQAKNIADKLAKRITVDGKSMSVAEVILQIGDLTSTVAVSEPVADPPNIALLRALLAEAIGTAMIVLFGCGSVCSSLSGAYQGIWQVASVWGFGVALAIYATAEASGAHLNPAVTLAFLLVRPQAHGMTWRNSALYVTAQFAG